MNIELTSVPDEIAADVFQAVEFFGNFLFPDVASEVYIDLEMVDSDYDLVGECFCDDAEDDGALRFFTIFVREDYENIFDLFATISHEMIHVKQMVYGELVEATVMKMVDGDFRSMRSEVWNGEIWEPGEGEDSYYDAPWEVEAFELENVVAEEFLQCRGEV